VFVFPGQDLERQEVRDGGDRKVEAGEDFYWKRVL